MAGRPRRAAVLGTLAALILLTGTIAPSLEADLASPAPTNTIPAAAPDDLIDPLAAEDGTVVVRDGDTIDVHQAVGPHRWVQAAEIAPPSEASKWFGWSIDLDGDRIAIGDIRYGDGRGGVLVYEPDPSGTWTLTETLRPDHSLPDSFGSTVVAEDDHIAVAAADVIYVFGPDEQGWALETKLSGEHGAGDDMGMDGGTIVFESNRDLLSSHHLDGHRWAQPQAVEDPNGFYIASVIVEEGTMVVDTVCQACLTLFGGTGEMAFYQHTADGWTIEERRDSHFPMALDGSKALVGATFTPELHERGPDGDWEHQQRLAPAAWGPSELTETHALILDEADNTTYSFALDPVPEPSP